MALLDIRHKYGRVILVMLAAALLAVCAPCSAEPPSAPEYDVKAAFVYNFTKFVDWPEVSFRNSLTPLTICVSGKGAVERSFVPIKGKYVKGREVVVVANEQIQNPRVCHVLFVTSTDKRRAAQLLESVRGAAVLTIGETPEFLDYGGVIAFTTSDEKIRFEVNNQAARKVRLNISSQLLRLADSVRGQE